MKVVLLTRKNSQYDWYSPNFTKRVLHIYTKRQLLCGFPSIFFNCPGVDTFSGFPENGEEHQEDKCSELQATGNTTAFMQTTIARPAGQNVEPICSGHMAHVKLTPEDKGQNERSGNTSCTSPHCELSKKTLERGLREDDSDNWCDVCIDNWKCIKKRERFHPECEDVIHFFENGGALRPFFVKCKMCKVLKNRKTLTDSVCKRCYVEEVRPTLPDNELADWNTDWRCVASFFREM